MALHKKSYRASSLCSLCVLCVSVVKKSFVKTTTETQRTQRLHREEQCVTTFQAKPRQLLITLLLLQRFYLLVDHCLHRIEACSLGANRVDGGFKLLN